MWKRTQNKLLGLMMLTGIALFTCCTSNRFERFESKSAYLNELNNTEAGKLEEKIRQDADELGELLEIVRPMHFYLGLSMELNTEGDFDTLVDTVGAFRLFNRDSVLAPDFDTLTC